MKETMRLRMLLAYDGSEFDGWQSQREGNAVQDHLEKAFAAVLGKTVRVHGSGRTDAGVHALAQVAHADVPSKITAARWREALNGNLPRGIRVRKTTRARGDFHARFSASGKIYQYRIWNATYLHPLERGRAWHVPWRIDRRLLAEALAAFEGEHDFASFSAKRGKEPENTVRYLKRARVKSQGELLTLTFEGDGFLYKMVRMLVGGGIRVACGREPMEWLGHHLENPVPGKARYCAPPEGLYLVRVLYGEKVKRGNQARRS
jgi:tRNA pseudouridine38-40 synthase